MTARQKSDGGFVGAEGDENVVGEDDQQDRPPNLLQGVFELLSGEIPRGA